MSLEISHGPVRRGRRTVLEAGRIATRAGSVAVVGINGSGKSSLFMHLADTLLTARSSARVSVHGRPATLAYVPQQPVLPGWLKVPDVAAMYGLDYDSLVASMPALHLTEMANASAAALSTGQRQALAIAFALGRDTDVTLLDEPFSALDFRRRIGAMDLLRQRRDRGRAFLLCSQSAADLLELCDWFVVIRDGRYVFDGGRTDLAGGEDEREMERVLLRLLA